ncbi:MAG: hypothetical protein K8F91_18845 [Candidatus Obscuribacterales bacterium]|nr:hypothetical protein [Candidatus Obscuribacterales bacterium]
MRQFDDIQSDARNPDVVQVSQNLSDIHTPIESGEVLRPVLESGGKLIEGTIDVGKNKYKYEIEHPHRGRELERMSVIPEESWHQAYEAFPELKDIGQVNQQDGIRLMKAILANELDHYGPVDSAEDIITQASKGTLLQDKTIGWAQISVNGVRNYARELQQEMESGKRESIPLSRYLQMTEEQIMQSLNDPKELPMLIAANVAHNVRMYQRHGYEPSLNNLGYGFNPDRPRTDGKPGKSLLPSDDELAKSEHAHNVMRWFKKVR